MTFTGPVVGVHDEFEFAYRSRFKAQLAQHGLLIEYDEDRAALDLGLHPYAPGHAPSGGRLLLPVRAWFQAKGLHAATWPAAKFDAVHGARLSLSVEQLAYWYGDAEPVHLVVYVESVDRFLVAQVRDLVEDQLGGFDGLRRLHDHQQGTVTMVLDESCTLEAALARMPAHRVLRVDGPQWRGRPLGHRYDPMRSCLARMHPDMFTEVVNRLLAAHRFHLVREWDTTALSAAVGRTVVLEGVMALTYEWVMPMMTEYGSSPGAIMRDESPTFGAQGAVLVVVHSDPDLEACRRENLAGAAEPLRQWAAEHPDAKILVLFNDTSDLRWFGTWRVALDDLAGFPQGLASLAFNVLTATTVYLDYRDKIGFEFTNTLWS